MLGGSLGISRCSFIVILTISTAFNYAAELEHSEHNNHVDSLQQKDDVEDINQGLYSHDQIDNAIGKVDLDMKIPPALLNARRKRAVLATEEIKWPNSTVPYQFDESTPISDDLKQTTMEAFEHISENTCVRFVERTNEKDYIIVSRAEPGCWSYVGRLGGGQQLNLGNGCDTIAVVVHETLHALGFLHEHNRPDRDQYVAINTVNIEAGAESSFQKFSLDNYGGISLADIPYDKQSVMHYSRFAFSRFQAQSLVVIRKEYMTIYSKADENEKLGNDTGLSKSDILRVNKQYGCQAPVSTSKPIDTTPSKKPATEKTTTKTTEDPKTPFTEEIKTPVTEEIKTPVTEETKTPVTKEPKTPFTEETKTPITEETKTPVTEEPKTPFTEETKTPVTEEPKTPVTEETKTPITKNPVKKISTTPDCEQTKPKREWRKKKKHLLKKILNQVKKAKKFKKKKAKIGQKFMQFLKEKKIKMLGKSKKFIRG